MSCPSVTLERGSSLVLIAREVLQLEAERLVRLHAGDHDVSAAIHELTLAEVQAKLGQLGQLGQVSRGCPASRAPKRTANYRSARSAA